MGTHRGTTPPVATPPDDDDAYYGSNTYWCGMGVASATMPAPDRGFLPYDDHDHGHHRRELATTPFIQKGDDTRGNATTRPRGWHFPKTQWEWTPSNVHHSPRASFTARRGLPEPTTDHSGLYHGYLWLNYRQFFSHTPENMHLWQNYRQFCIFVLGNLGAKFGYNYKLRQLCKK